MLPGLDVEHVLVRILRRGGQRVGKAHFARVVENEFVRLNADSRSRPQRAADITQTAVAAWDKRSTVGACGDEVRLITPWSTSGGQRFAMKP